jgi:phosphatidylinositol glycan class B
MTVGMLTPCHSTPWRSHLQYPPSETLAGIRAWALTCEPPLGLNATEKADYLDEADMFYADPQTWLKKNMSRHPPRRKDGTRATGFASGVFAPDPRHKRALNINSEILDTAREEQFWSTGQGRRPWPDYLIFFAQLEPTLQVSLRGSGYLECKRLFNSHWHDDRRRTGDLVIWCLDVGRSEGTRPTADISMQLVEDAIHDPNSNSGGQDVKAGQKILDNKEKGQGTTKKKQTKKKEPITRVVDKPFWKLRQPRDED